MKFKYKEGQRVKAIACKLGQTILAGKVVGPCEINYKPYYWVDFELQENSKLMLVNERDIVEALDEG